MSAAKSERDAIVRPTFGEAFRFWLKLGFISFGGPAGQIAIMHAELVERRKWISEARFLHALNYCMLLPGPEAQQLAIYAGWLLHKTWGGIVAGVLFVLPSAFILWGLSWVYVEHGDLPWVAAILGGLKPAVLAIVASAVLRIGSKALKNEVLWGIAIAAFIAIFFLNVPFPAILIGAGLIGLLGGLSAWRGKFLVATPHAAATDEMDLAESETPPSWARALRVTLVCVAFWGAPIVAAGLWLGWNHALVKEGIFFSKAAMVTFGGAYAVLPYVSQQAVENFGWLNASQMLDGLGLAETTPGPLIMVLQFVGFLGGWNQPGSLPPILAATLGAAITTWTTFTPCFYWIFLGAPHIERLRRHQELATILPAITAAVVGVILNLAVWFGLHLWFPKANQLDWFSIALSIAAFISLTRLKWPMIPVILISALAGWLYGTFF